MFLYTERLNLLSELDSPEKARFGVLGVPFDSTETSIPGQRFGPNAIRESFLSMEAQELPGIYDLGNLLVVHGDAKETLKRTENTLNDLFMKNKKIIPVILGGEHTITLAPVKILKEKYPDLQVVSLDAHYDLKDKYQGVKLAHTTVMRRVHEACKNLAIIGARAGDKDEKAFAENIKSGLENMNPGKPTYVSLDMDVFDPRYCPGVGDPEPSGLSSKDGLELIKQLKKFNIAGFDIVEANPLVEKQVSSNLAAKCLIEFLR